MLHQFFQPSTQEPASKKPKKDHEEKKEAKVLQPPQSAGRLHNQFTLETIPDEKMSAQKKRLLSEASTRLDVFLTGMLTTERSHPLTVGMAERAQNDETLPGIIEDCINVDIAALTKLMEYLNSDKFFELVAAIRETLARGGKIYIAGCGASGRLALLVAKHVLEILGEPYKDKIIGVIAGGPFALVRPIEDFEDKGEYGIQQLLTQGFNPAKDLYLGVSASGSAKFNNYPIWNQAKNLEGKSENRHLQPWLICCNDPTELKKSMEEQYRTAQLTDKDAKSPHPLVDCASNMQCLGLDVGPNALSGSSRMQSATVSELALYYAPLLATGKCSQEYINSQLSLLIQRLREAKFSQTLRPFIQRESETYENKRNMIYKSHSKNALTVFTDLTERSPTFNLSKIENSNIPQDEYAWCSLNINDVENPEGSFPAMLGCNPVSLNWSHEPRTSSDMLRGFNFSNGAQERRKKLTGKDHNIISIDSESEPDTLILRYTGESKESSIEARLNVAGLDPFSRQVFLKILLNTHSTLVMARQKKFKSNLMTNLGISNGKLFSRVVRSVSEEVKSLLNRAGLNVFSNQVSTPHIPVNHVTQGIAMAVMDTYIEDKKTNQTTVEQATQTFLNAAGITPENLPRLRTQQAVASQEIVFNESDQKYGDVKGHTQRRAKLTAFFAMRHQLSGQVTESVVKKYTRKPSG